MRIRIYILMLLISFENKLLSQNSILDNYTPPSKSINIGIELAVFKGLHFNDEKGTQIIRSRPVPSPIVSLGYKSINSKNWGLYTNLNVGFSPINIAYTTNELDNHNVMFSDGSQFDLNIKENETYYIGTGFLSLEMIALKYRPLKKDRALIYGLGMSLFRGWFDKSAGEIGGLEIQPDENSNTYIIFSAINDIDTTRIPWKPSIKIQLGIEVKKNIEVFIRGNYSLVEWFSGSYSFFNLGFPSTGRYSKNFSYIGFQLVYSIPIRNNLFNKH